MRSINLDQFGPSIVNLLDAQKKLCITFINSFHTHSRTIQQKVNAPRPIAKVLLGQ